MKTEPARAILIGFGFTGYRSFWSERTQIVGPLSKTHLLVGQNNSGKSNALRVAETFIPKFASRKKAEGPTGYDRPRINGTAQQFRLALAFDLQSDRYVTAAFGRSAHELQDHEVQSVETIVSLFGEYFEQHAPWFEFELGSDSSAARFIPSTRQLNFVVERYNQQTFIGGYRGPVRLASIHPRDRLTTMSPATDQQALSNFVDALDLPLEAPPIATISAFRQIREHTGNEETSSRAEDYSGLGLVKKLAFIQNPPLETHDKDVAKFAEINRFVQTVLEDPSARLTIPAGQDRILVEHGGRILDLDNLGTGVHEVIILAAAATVLEEHLVCIEEPEVHLHPVLQRRLLAYLHQHTSNRYLIATHSAHFLDAASSSISHVKIDEGGSRVDASATAAEVANIARDLGYRASDLVQANSVIWVEGPSDRIYISHWLRRFDDQLVEGVHFSIMFYGGALLNHLSVDDEEVQEFISLPKLNRHFVLVIDSDRTSPSKRVNKTKAAVVKALKDKFGQTGYAWVTHGYTIENYIPPRILTTALKALHPQASPTWSGDNYQNPLSLERAGHTGRVSKVAVARQVVRHWDHLENNAELRGEIIKLVHFIRAANDLPGKEFRGRGAGKRRIDANG
jgi:hypothetical protein